MDTTFGLADDNSYIVARTNQNTTTAMGGRLFAAIAAEIAAAVLTKVLLDARPQTVLLLPLVAHEAGIYIAQGYPLGRAPRP